MYNSTVSTQHTTTLYLGAYTCADWLLKSDVSEDVKSILRNNFDSRQVVRAELLPEKSVLRLSCGDATSIDVSLEVKSLPQHLGFFPYHELLPDSKMWCKAAREKFAQFACHPETMIEAVYYPDFFVLKLSSLPKNGDLSLPQFVYVPNVVPTVDNG